MSFAFRSQRGSFEIPQEEVRQTRRFNVYIPRKENPGPGSYDVPVAFDKRSDESYMMEKGMSVFKSESKRFSEIETIPKAPGPGTYESDRKLIPNRRLSYKPKLIEQLMFAAQYQSINSIPYEKRPEIGLGPGQYNCLGQFDTLRQRKYLNQPTQISTNPQSNVSLIGPGSYDIDRFYKPKSYSIGRYHQANHKKLKCYVKKGLNNKVYYSFDQQPDEDSSEYEFINDSTPGPGSYDQSTKSTFQQKDSKNSKKSLVNQAPRFMAKIVDLLPGPGSYNPALKSPRVKQVDFGKCERFITDQPTDSSPGPQYYSPKDGMTDRLVDRLSKQPDGNFGRKSPRFDEKNKKTPGPGSYLESRLSKDNKTQSPTNQFKSTSNRELYSQTQLSPSPGTYDLEKESISYKVSKQIEERKELYVSKPPFGVGDQRFKQKTIEEECEDDQIDKQPNLRFKTKAKQPPAFASAQKRFSMDEKSITPSPWEYDTPSKWTKRSFNYQYAKV